MQLVESWQGPKSRVTQLFVPLMAFPNRMTWKEIQSAKQVALLKQEEEKIIAKERQQISALLQRAQHRALAPKVVRPSGGFFCCSSPVKD